METRVFESEFLTPNESGKQTFTGAIHQALETICSALPQQPYAGKAPADLDQLIGSELLPQHGSAAEVAHKLAQAVSNSIILTHPNTAAHLHSAPLLSALAAEVAISALNQSMDSFDQGPFASVLEQKMLRLLCDEAGLPETAAGTFTTGGSQSNYMGLMLARDACLQSHWNWSAQKSGLPPEARRLRILCSEIAHFTVEKSVAQLGLGTDAVVRVPVDENFRMKPAALAAVLNELGSQNLLPLAVVATAGTTDFGSIDPLPEISALARQYGTWFHVDAAYGGASLFSQQHRNKLRGIESADSISIDFHKLLWQPIPCSVFLLRDQSHFDLIKLHADYLNPESHEDAGIPDLVTRSLLTTRRADALKLWITFQTLGREKLGTMIDRTLELAAFAAKAIRNHPQLELRHEPELSTAVFRYAPASPKVDTDIINKKIRDRLFETGRAIIGHTRVNGRQCLKFTCMNPTVTNDEMENLVRLVAEQGARLEKEML